MTCQLGTIVTSHTVGVQNSWGHLLFLFVGTVGPSHLPPYSRSAP